MTDPLTGDEQEITTTEDITEAGTARLFLRLTEGQVKYSEYHKAWIAWDALKQQWSTSEVILYRQIDRVGRRQSAKAHLKILESSRVESMLDRASKMEAFRLAPDMVDADPYLVGCANGVIDIRTRTLRENRLEDYVTLYSPVRYMSNPKRGRFASFVRETQPNDEIRQYLRKWAGSCLTPDTNDQLFHVFLGEGSNGKTRYLDALCKVLGPMATVATENLFVRNKTASTRFSMPILIDARLIRTAELPTQSQLDDATVKRLTGEIEVQVEQKGQPVRIGRMKGKIVIMANNMPSITDHTYSTARRLRIIPWLQQFDPSGEPNLLQNLYDDAEYVLYDMVEGAFWWYQERLALPESIKLSSGELVAEATRDDLDFFLEERITKSPGNKMMGESFYRAYCDWVQPRKPITQTMFGREIAKRGYFKSREARGMVYHDIGLAPHRAGLV